MERSSLVRKDQSENAEIIVQKQFLRKKKLFFVYFMSVLIIFLIEKSCSQ